MSKRKTSPLWVRRKPLPTVDEQIAKTNRTVYCVAVWWHEGYGGTDVCKTLEDARAKAKALERLGYPKAGISQVHIWRNTVELLDVIEAKEPEVGE